MNLNRPGKFTRCFLYKDDKNVVLGSQSIRYEPDIKKDIYGSIEVESAYPKKKSIKLAFRLTEYPEFVDRKEAASNISPEDVGILNMKREANRSTALLVRSICGIKEDKFSYDDLVILDKDIILKENGTKGSVIRGVITKNVLFLRKNDIVNVTAIDQVDDDNFECLIVYDPYDHGKSFIDSIRKKFLKIFNKKLYAKRYGQCSRLNFSEIAIKLDCIKILGDHVEDGTKR